MSAFFLQRKCPTIYNQYWNEKLQYCPKVSFLQSKFQDRWQTGVWLWVVFSFLKCDSYCLKAASFRFSLVSSSDPMTSLKRLTELFLFLTSSMSLLQVKFHSSVSTFPEKSFLFTQNKYFEKLHSAGETRNFETKFIISIHLSYFQSYHGVQM